MKSPRLPLESPLHELKSEFLYFRKGFDISLPLWPIDHPTNGKHSASLPISHWPPSSKYLVSFKGKRYLHGIGSEVRNSLHHIHDGQVGQIRVKWGSNEGQIGCFTFHFRDQ